MIIDNNLIAYDYYKNPFVPNEVYTSGKRDETNLINKYSKNGLNAPIITLKDDIINEDGYGLKRGFYSVYPDKYMDFLYIYQSGKLKAKIPVIKMEVYENINPKEEKVKKMSLRKYNREQMKKRQKEYLGENPETMEWSEANIFKLEEKNSWIVTYCTNNIELWGIIKF